MPNPDPIQSEEFKAQQFQPKGEAPLGKKTFGVRFPETIEGQLLEMEDAYDFIRTAVAEKLAKEAGQ